MYKKKLILGENQEYNMNCHETGLNNNVLVVGTSGSGKTRSIVTPNLLQAEGSYIVSDPKGNLYNQYKGYLENRGYVVKKLDFTDMTGSVHYNFLNYIHSTFDIVQIAHVLVNNIENVYNRDPFWDQASQLLVQAVIAYLKEACSKDEQNLHGLCNLITLCNVNTDNEVFETVLDMLMDKLKKRNPDSYAAATYAKFRIAANRTLRSILITANAKIGVFDVPEIAELTSNDDVDIESIGKRKTALFVVVSDTDRSMDILANIFFTQAMNVLCRYADKKTRNYCLPVPVRFILDDFATNCKIDQFPRMIASIRSRGISVMIMIQAEAQLTQCYGYDGKTILGNCDTYVYLGGNDVETAKAVAERSDVPVMRILNMPVGTNWIFRRGQQPVNGQNYDYDKHIAKNKNRSDVCEMALI